MATAGAVLSKGVWAHQTLIGLRARVLDGSIDLARRARLRSAGETATASVTEAPGATFPLGPRSATAEQGPAPAALVPQTDRPPFREPDAVDGVCDADPTADFYEDADGALDVDDDPGLAALEVSLNQVLETLLPGVDLDAAAPGAPWARADQRDFVGADPDDPIRSHGCQPVKQPVSRTAARAGPSSVNADTEPIPVPG